MSRERVDDISPEIGERKGTGSGWTHRLVQLLVEPRGELPAGDAFRARVVTTLVLVNMVCALVAALVVLIGRMVEAPGVIWIFALTAPTNLGMYLLARTRHYRWSGMLLVLQVPVGVIPSVMLISDPATFAVAMCWLVVGVGIASFILPGWASVVVLAVFLLIPPVMVRIVGHSAAMLVGLELFILTSSFIILFHNWVIRRSERVSELQRQAQQEQILALRLAEAALYSREDQLRITVDSIGDGVIVADSDGHITELNPMAAELLGRSVSQGRGQPLDEVLSLGDPDTGMPSTLVELEGAEGEPVDALLLREGDEDDRKVEITRSPLRDLTGAIVGAVLVLRDHTDRLALEEQLQQAQRLEAVGRLAGGVAHDFNNLLFSISSLAEIMEMSAEEGFPFHQELRDILEVVDRGSTLTAQLLAFSRRQVLQLELLDLSQVTGELTKMLRRVIGENISLEVLTGSEPVEVRADRSQLEQILLNLALNARDAMPQGGRLTLETGVVSLGADELEQVPELTPGRYALLAVTDTGAGMSEEVRQRIFEPFFTTKDRGRGSGLGLSMVYGLVQQHGGHIQVYSAAEQGTVIKVYLPWAEPDDFPVNGLADEPPLPGTGETILLAEDEEMPRQLVSRTLTQLGYRVIAAVDGVHALELAAEHEGPIDLLLSDVLMPRMAGPELYAALLEERPDLQVVYLSGYTDNTVADHGVLDEGVSFLQKPVSVRKLARKLRQVLNGS